MIITLPAAAVPFGGDSRTTAPQAEFHTASGDRLSHPVAVRSAVPARSATETVLLHEHAGGSVNKHDHRCLIWRDRDGATACWNWTS